MAWGRPASCRYPSQRAGSARKPTWPLPGERGRFAVRDSGRGVVLTRAYARDRLVIRRRVVERDWTGHVEQKNFALRKGSFEWALSPNAGDRLGAHLGQATPAKGEARVRSQACVVAHRLFFANPAPQSRSTEVPTIIQRRTATPCWKS